MSLVTLHLRMSESKETIGKINDVVFDAPLHDLRRKIDTELSLGEYHFVVFGTPLKRKQEKKHLVSSCVGKSEKPQIYFCYLKTVQTPQCSTTSKVTEEDWQDIENSPVFTEIHSEPANINLEKSSMIGRAYSDNEIKNATGLLEKERMIFANNKAKEITSDSFFTNWGYHEIQGVIDVHWTLKKTELLKSCIQELVSKSNIDNDGPSLKTVLKNADILDRAQFLTDQHYKRFSEEISHHDGESRRDELENQFDETFSNLKSAQCNVLKSIEQYNKAVTEHAAVLYTDKDEQSSTEKDDPAGCPVLQDEEMDFLVASVKDDYEQEI